MWGYSGGSIASEWAAELQVQCAPEFSFAGAALSGLVPNVTRSVETISGTVWAGLIPPGLLGMTSQSPEAHEFLLSKLKASGPYNRTGFLSTYYINVAQAVVTFAGQNIFDYLEGGIATYNSPILQKVINRNGFTGYHGVPEMPMFVYKAIVDECSPIADTDELVQRYCDVGANILYQRNRIGGHEAEETNGDAQAFEWLSGVSEGASGLKNSIVGCIIEDVTVNVTDSLLR
jgi:Secretory lipase